MHPTVFLAGHRPATPLLGPKVSSNACSQALISKTRRHGCSARLPSNFGRLDRLREAFEPRHSLADAAVQGFMRGRLSCHSHVPNSLQQAPKIRRQHKAHGSISVQEGQRQRVDWRSRARSTAPPEPPRAAQQGGLAPVARGFTMRSPHAARRSRPRCRRRRAGIRTEQHRVFIGKPGGATTPRRDRCPADDARPAGSARCSAPRARSYV